MKSLFVIATASMALLGCASKPISNSEATLSSTILNQSFSERKEGYASLIIKRDSGFGGYACSSRVYIDGVAVVDLDPGEYYNAFVNPGGHIISSKPNGICSGGLYETNINAKENQNLTYRIGYGSNGDYFIVPTAF